MPQRILAEQGLRLELVHRHVDEAEVGCSSQAPA